MAFISGLSELVAGLREYPEIDVDASSLTEGARMLSDASVLEVMARASAIVNAAQRLLVSTAGVAAARSTRSHGHGGLAQTRGHRSPVALVQSITGASKGDAARSVRLGESLLEGCEEPTPPAVAEGRGAEASVDSRVPWHEPLRAGLLCGALTTAQHDAILRGLGEPPCMVEHVSASASIERTFDTESSAESAEARSSEWRAVWSLAAEQLLAEAPRCTPEELLRGARQVRDRLDPDGAADRFARRYEARSFRMWADDHGQHRAHLVLDDEGAAWLRAMVDAFMRPRRGGPRFVDSDERASAQRLIDDPRTNDQLAYDLVIDTLRSGSLATASEVFGTRQAGVRIIVTEPVLASRDESGRLTGIAHTEDGGETLPGSVADRTLCTSGGRRVTVDPFGNPLRLGRESRLFSAKQRIALAVRDGGCMFPECAMPASYCEAHHIDHFVADEGRTDIDRGILLCRFHHMLLHNNGWKITRTDHAPFMLHPPGEGGGGRGHDAVQLSSRSPLRWSWDPPPPTPRPDAVPPGVTSDVA